MIRLVSDDRSTILYFVISGFVHCKNVWFNDNKQFPWENYVCIFLLVFLIILIPFYKWIQTKPTIKTKAVQCLYNDMIKPLKKHAWWLSEFRHALCLNACEIRAKNMLLRIAPGFVFVCFFIIVEVFFESSVPCHWDSDVHNYRIMWKYRVVFVNN